MTIDRDKLRELPAAVLALLDALDEAEQKRDDYDDALRHAVAAETRAAKERDEACAEVERLRELLAEARAFLDDADSNVKEYRNALASIDAALAGKDGAR